MKLKHLYYGWVMVVIGASVLAMARIGKDNFGVFLVPLTTEFNWDRGPLSVALSIGMLVTGFLAIFIGRLSDKYGPRILITTSGLLIGIGLLLMSQINSLWQVYLIWGLLIGVAGRTCDIVLLSTIPRWFTKKRGIAMGLTVIGIALGGIISAPLAQWLISAYSWQQAFIILGLIIIIILPSVAQLMKHSPQRIGLRPYGEDRTVKDEQPSASAAGGLPLKQAIKTGGFWLFGLIQFCIVFLMATISTHIIPYAIDIGISPMVAASILSVSAGSSIIGRLSSGFVSDRLGCRLALSACVILMTLSLIWLLFAREIWALYVFAAFFGIAYGGGGTLVSVVPAELFGLKFLGTILGGIMLVDAFGGALGPPLAGTIFDVTGNYSLAFQICVVISALAVILSLILLKAKRWHGSD